MQEVNITGGFRHHDVELIAGLLNEGGIGIIPTDTVYGLAALATSEDALNRLLEIKARPADKPFPVQCPTINHAEEIAVLDKEPARLLAEAFWPGALTLVLDMKPGIKMPHQGPDTIGIRIPDNIFCLTLLDMVRYLVVPSANPPGAAPPTVPGEIQDSIIAGVDFLVDGGRCTAGRQSTVVDISSPALTDANTLGKTMRYYQGEKGYRILREGAVSREEIERALGYGECSQ